MRTKGMKIADLRLEDCINDTCPWSGKPVQADSLTLYEGYVVGFCNPGCRDKFEQALAHFERAQASPAPGRRRS
jgi:hypothetical protein